MNDSLYVRKDIAMQIVSKVCSDLRYSMELMLADVPIEQRSLTHAVSELLTAILHKLEAQLKKELSEVN